LNFENYKTQQGKAFTKVQVKRILDRRAFYSGIYRYANIESIGLHQAII
jgi:site-specific DNA recombinase